MVARMKFLTPTAIPVAVVLSALLGACSSSESTPAGQVEDDPSGSPAQPDVPVTPPQTGSEPGEQPPGEQPPSEPPPNDSPAEPPLGMLIPAVTEGGDLDRLLRGLTRQVSRTVLDLNGRLAEGTELTPQQDVCLGAYDPALGEQLLGVSCEQPLATGDVAMYVERASFYDTSACHAAIAEGSSTPCVLQQARINIPTQWIIPELPADSPPGTPQRPQPIAGMEIYYAIDDTFLRIENTESALTGFFRCDLDLADQQATTQIPGQSCADIIRNTADRIDALIPE